MANGIYSPVPPRPLRAGDKVVGETDFFQGDAIYEQLNGENGALAAIENNPITNLTITQKIDLLHMAGINVRRGLSGS